MDGSPPLEEILDGRHEDARIARLSKDYNAYADIFAPELIFGLKGGYATGRDRMMRNVKAHDRRFQIIDLVLRREGLREEGDDVVETIAHRASIEVRLFLGLHYRWTTIRLSEFVWRHRDSVWRVHRACALAEATTSRGIRWR